MSEDAVETGTKQKYTLIYMGEVGLQYEVYDFKNMLRKKLKEIDRADVRLIIKGRKMKIKVEERLTV